MSVLEKTQTMSAGEPAKALWMSTIAFTLCFAVWTIFAIIGIRIKQELGLNEAQFGLLVGTPILTGSLVRIVLGIWTGRYGGRLVYTLTMLAAALATFLLSYAHTYAADADRRRSASALRAARLPLASPMSRPSFPPKSRERRSASSAPATSARQ